MYLLKVITLYKCFSGANFNYFAAVSCTKQMLCIFFYSYNPSKYNIEIITTTLVKCTYYRYFYQILQINNNIILLRSAHVY